MSSILVLQTDPFARDRIRRAIALESAAHVRHRVRWHSGWEDLSAAAASNPLDLAIVDPFHPPGAGRGLATFTHCFQGATLLAYGDFTGRPAADVVRIVRLGVAAVLTLGVDDDPPGIARALLHCTGHRAFGPLLQAFQERYSPDVAATLERLLHAATEPLSPGNLARRLGQNRRTLERLLHAHRLPPPAATFTWFRLLHAVRLLEDPGRGIENVAFGLGFGSGSALSSALNRYTGCRAREIINRGGVAYLTRVLLRAFSRAGAPGVAV